MEEEMVCITASASGVLQDLCGVPTSSTAQSERCPLVHTSRVEEASVHFRGCYICQNVLSSGTEPRRGTAMGGGHSGCTRDPHDDFDSNVAEYAGNDTRGPSNAQSQRHHNATSRSSVACAKHHVFRLGGCLAERSTDRVDVFTESADDRFLAYSATRSAERCDCKDSCIRLLDEMRFETT